MSLTAGEILVVELLEGPQIVGLLPFSSYDFDERLWAQETMLLEGFWLSRYTRLWGTMARCRPLLTCLDDTVRTKRVTGGQRASHHPIVGGWNTPRQWELAGGAPDQLTVWEQLVAGLAEHGQAAELVKEELGLFAKAQLDPYTLRQRLLPSDATVGDSVVLFAEMDLVVMFALSPYVDGKSVSLAGLAATDPRPVRLSRREKIADPLPWPYPGGGYPDLGLYVDAAGYRTSRTEATPGVRDSAPRAGSSVA